MQSKELKLFFNPFKLMMKSKTFFYKENPKTLTVLYNISFLTPEIKKLVILYSSIKNDCEYCFENYFTALKEIKFSKEKINSLKQKNINLSLFSDKEKTVIEYIDSWFEQNGFTSAVKSRLSDYFTIAQALEIDALLSTGSFISKFLNLAS